MRMFLFLVILVMFSAQAHALSVSPLPRVDLVDGMGKLTVTDSDRWLRADIFRVEITNGKEELRQTTADEVQISPRIFKAPNEVRIAVNRRPDKVKEAFYKILIVEQVIVGNQTGLIPGVGALIPVVWQPENPVEKFTAKAVRDGCYVENSGNVHIRLVSGGQPLYVLAGSTRVVPLNAKKTGGNAVCVD